MLTLRLDRLTAGLRRYEGVGGAKRAELDAMAYLGKIVDAITADGVSVVLLLTGVFSIGKRGEAALVAELPAFSPSQQFVYSKTQGKVLALVGASLFAVPLGKGPGGVVQLKPNIDLGSFGQLTLISFKHICVLVGDQAVYQLAVQGGMADAQLAARAPISEVLFVGPGFFVFSHEQIFESQADVFLFSLQTMTARDVIGMSKRRFIVAMRTACSSRHGQTLGPSTMKALFGDGLASYTAFVDGADGEGAPEERNAPPDLTASCSSAFSALDDRADEEGVLE